MITKREFYIDGQWVAPLEARACTGTPSWPTYGGSGSTLGAACGAVVAHPPQTRLMAISAYTGGITGRA